MKIGKFNKPSNLELVAPLLMHVGGVALIEVLRGYGAPIGEGFFDEGYLRSLEKSLHFIAVTMYFFYLFFHSNLLNGLKCIVLSFFSIISFGSEWVIECMRYFGKIRSYNETPTEVITAFESSFLTRKYYLTATGMMFLLMLIVFYFRIERRDRKQFEGE